MASTGPATVVYRRPTGNRRSEPTGGTRVGGCRRTFGRVNSAVLVALLPSLYMLFVTGMVATAFLASLYMLLMRRMIAAAGATTFGSDLSLLVVVH